MVVANASHSIPRDSSSAAAVIVTAGGKKAGRRSRGWTPLKYPKSAILTEDKEAAARSLPYFPLHPDVLSAAVRELLVLEGKIDNVTLKVLHEKATPGEKCSADSESSAKALTSYAEGLECSHSTGNPRKRKIGSGYRNNTKLAPSDCMHQRYCHLQTTTENAQVFPQAPNCEMQINYSRTTLAEDMVFSIVQRFRVVSPATKLSNAENETSGISQAVVVRPRKVSEADQALPPPSSFLRPLTTDDIGGEASSEICSKEISCFLDLTRHDENGSFPLIYTGCDIPPMLHASISNEALLRDAAMTLTTNLMQHFQQRSLRLFFGYKTPAISHDRLAQLTAGFLFDASHAMFAWEQTERELLSQNPNLVDPDTTIQKSLFNQRAVKKLGGFKPHGILPQAISIGRLRRRNVSWEEFAKTAQGKQMLAHHLKESTKISAGKQRRGQRLRQRHWLTSALLWHDNEEASIATVPRSRSCSISSETDDDFFQPSTKARKFDVDLNHQFRILSDMPGSKSVILTKESSALSWGVGLVQEGSACVVGRAQSYPDKSSKDSHLQCGDMILYVQSEHGEEAGSPFSSWSGSQPAGEDWFQRIVDLFKNSTELHLVIQRV